MRKNILDDYFDDGSFKLEFTGLSQWLISRESAKTFCCLLEVIMDTAFNTMGTKS